MHKGLNPQQPEKKGSGDQNSLPGRYLQFFIKLKNKNKLKMNKKLILRIFKLKCRFKAIIHQTKALRK